MFAKGIYSGFATIGFLILLLGIFQFVALNDAPELWAAGGDGIVGGVDAAQAASYYTTGWWMVGIGLCMLFGFGSLSKSS